jgi:hypothetical protein
MVGETFLYHSGRIIEIKKENILKTLTRFFG